MEWEWLVSVLPECSALGVMIAFLVMLLRRETAEKKFWRSKAIGYLETTGEVTEVAREFAEEGNA